MTNWKDIHPDFTPELQKAWEGKVYPSDKPQFTFQEVQTWINKGLTLTDYDFAHYLKSKDHNPNQILDLDALRKEYQNNLDWLSTGGDFSLNEKFYQQVWENYNFTYQEFQQWTVAGAELDDYEFVIWLRDIKNYTPEWITNYKEDYQTLSYRFREYGLCPEWKCKQPNTGEKWCKSCNEPRLRKKFANWTSGKVEIDQFIQKHQLEATDKDKFIEWIPYERFSDIKYLAEGGFGKVYKAQWAKGNINHWDAKNKKWYRKKDYHHLITLTKNKLKSQSYFSEKKKERNQKLESFFKNLPTNPDEFIKSLENIKKDLSKRLTNEEINNLYRAYQNQSKTVVLKSLNNSQDSTDFLDETEKHKIIDDWFNNIVPCYGLSQDPETKNYLMVMQYMPEGNLRHYLKNNNRKLSLEDKLSQLLHIAQGLKDIHAKNLAHRDFHSGNILKGIEKTSCLITDLGLCKPADEIKKEDQIFGVMPYVAPEVLRSRPYTQASDIYSFGMIIYEVLSGLPPYYDREHDVQLGLAICNGLRPQFQIKIPQLLEELIKQCWDTNPNQRPNAQELEKTLRSWEQREKKEFQNQLQEAEEYNKTLPDDIKFPDYKNKIHSGASYQSKLLPTKEISKLITEQYSESLAIDFTSLDSEQQTQILYNPPK